MPEQIFKTLGAIADAELLENEPLSRYLGFRTGGPARAVFAPHTRAALLTGLHELKAAKQRFYILGNGSNVLATDDGYDGVVVLTRYALDELSVNESAIHCGGGATLASTCRIALDNNLSGLEFAYGIPGTIGGAVYMNAGAYDGEMKAVVSSAEVLLSDGEITVLKADELCFEYRSSAIQRMNAVVLSADIKLNPGCKNEISSKMNDFMERRKAKQPLELPSCGSVFKRPKGAYAGALIESCGLRGYSIGGAQVSEKHCGFIVNTGDAKSNDILELIDYIQKTVKEKTGFNLECEIRMLR